MFSHMKDTLDFNWIEIFRTYKNHTQHAIDVRWGTWQRFCSREHIHLVCTRITMKFSRRIIRRIIYTSYVSSISINRTNHFFNPCKISKSRRQVTYNPFFSENLGMVHFSNEDIHSEHNITCDVPPEVETLDLQSIRPSKASSSNTNSDEH